MWSISIVNVWHRCHVMQYHGFLPLLLTITKTGRTVRLLFDKANLCSCILKQWCPHKHACFHVVNINAHVYISCFTIITHHSCIVMTAKWKRHQLLSTSSLVPSGSSSNTVVVLPSLAVAADAGGDMAGTMTGCGPPQTLPRLFSIQYLQTHTNATSAFKSVCSFRHAFWNWISSLKTVCSNTCDLIRLFVQRLRA